MKGTCMDRRDFIALGAGAAVGFGCGPVFAGTTEGDELLKFPRGGGLSPDYWCTWGIQNSIVAQDKKKKLSDLAGDQGAYAARNNINEEFLFGKDGWARTMCPGVRDRLFLVLDDGWDVEYDSHPAESLERFGFMEPWPERFPSCGKTSLERLTTINRRIRDAGWQGAGIWIAAQLRGDKPPKDDWKAYCAWRDASASPEVADYLKRKLELSAAAGVRYWKVDWGTRGGFTPFRRLMSEVKERVCPEIMVEHIPLTGWPFNGQKLDKKTGELIGDGRLDGFDNPDFADRLKFSDVLRVYDVMGAVRLATTVERAWGYAHYVDQCGSKTIVNVEDAPSLAAALGHAMQLLSSNVGRERAVNWHRFAPPFGGRKGYETVASEELFTERHVFRKGEGWREDIWGKEVKQVAPAVLARGLKLPTVKPLDGDKPFVAAGRNPNGATCVATLPRIRSNGDFYTPAAEVVLNDAVAFDRPFAVFGRPARVSVPLDRAPKRVYARDLGGGPVCELKGTAYANGRLTFDGAELARTGSMCAPNAAKFEPGTLIRFA